MRFFLTAAAQFDGVVGFDLDRTKRLLVDEADDRPKQEIRADHEGAGKDARYQLAGSGEGSDGLVTVTRSRAESGRG